MLRSYKNIEMKVLSSTGVFLSIWLYGSDIFVCHRTMYFAQKYEMRDERTINDVQYRCKVLPVLKKSL